MPEITIEMRFCRRCGTALTAKRPHEYICEQGHHIFMNAAAATCAVLYNAQGQTIVIERAIDPGKGALDMPGGFCDGGETFEDATRREIEEEVGLTPDQYGPLVYLGSGVDSYAFGGETGPVISVLYMAELQPGAQPKAGDDAATVSLVRFDDMPMDKVFFSSVRMAIERARARFNAPHTM